MEGPALIADALGRIQGTLERCLKGVDAELLRKMPTPETNPMGWLAWHLTRVQDHHLSALAGRPQAWTVDKWYERFGMPPDDQNIGTRHTLAQVAAFAADSAQTLLDYHSTVYARSKAYLELLQPADLDHVIDEPQWDPKPTVGVRLVSVVSDNTQHAGQIAYLRGYFQGFGWQSF